MLLLLAAAAAGSSSFHRPLSFRIVVASCSQEISLYLRVVNTSKDRKDRKEKSNNFYRDKIK